MSKTVTTNQPELEVDSWGFLGEEEILLYKFRNESGSTVVISNFGAIIQSISVPDRTGRFEDVVLGYDFLDDYLKSPYYMGGIIGRCAGRISGGIIDLDGISYKLSTNKFGFHHHGGQEGFDKKVWESTILKSNPFCLQLQYRSPDGEEGYPGNLSVSVKYIWTNQNQLWVEYSASTDKPTILSLTQHSYFNLRGHDAGEILNHRLLIPSEYYLPVNAQQIPTGLLKSVEATPFDFRKEKPIGQGIGDSHDQIILSNGYDHTFILKSLRSSELKFAARLGDEESGRVLKVFTSEPSVHFYAGNFLSSDYPGKNKANYPKRSGFCLETQNYPDAIHHTHFPSPILRPGEIFNSKTMFEFSVY